MSNIFTGAVEPLRLVLIVDGAPVSGATIRARVQRVDGLWLDWSVNQFKAWASITGSNGYRTLPAVANAAGVYLYSWDTSTVTNPTAPDIYTVLYDQTVPDVRTLIGQTEVRTGFLNAEIAATRAGLAAPGDAMTLTAPALTAVQAKILDDATPFHGASIAALVTFGAPPSAAANAAAVWATAEGGAVGSLRYALTLLRQRQNERRKLGADGWETIYVDGVAVKKARVLDVNGDPVVPQPGDPAEVLAEVDV